MVHQPINVKGAILKLPSLGLRAGILAQLLFVIIAAMLLVNVVMVKFSERDLIKSKVKSGRLLIQAVEQNIYYLSSGRNLGLKGISYDHAFDIKMSQLLEIGEFSEIVIVSRSGELIFETGTSKERRKEALIFARDSIGINSWSVNYSGSTWGVLWLSARYISISAPLLIEGKTLGVITVSASLQSIYQALRRSEKLLLFYILLDTVVLGIVGIYLLSRIIVKPIHKLLKMTEEYKGGDIIPFIDNTSSNEIGTLSRSLSVMLQKLEENKKELKNHIDSLEEANENLKRAQNEIVRSEKLASVGRLAAGVAHEIGNPIGIILGYLELLKKNNVSGDEKKDFLRRVESEITRINKIITQLLDFSRPSSGEKKECYLHELIKDTIEMLKPQPMMEEIDVKFILDAGQDNVLADPNKLQQVFLNIIMNAVDVLSQDHQQTTDESESELTIKSENSNGSILIRFIDNGPGIPEEELGSIFDPFYTTKDPGKGTGLGLYVCYSIIDEQGGNISAESSEGNGTMISVQLPLS